MWIVDTITELRAENERLTQNRDYWQQIAREDRAEAERLRADRDHWKDCYDAEGDDLAKQCDVIRRLRAEVKDLKSLVAQYESLVIPAHEQTVDRLAAGITDENRHDEH